MQATAALHNTWNMWPTAAGGGASDAHDLGLDDTDSLISMSLSMFEEDLFFGLGPLDSNNNTSSLQKHFGYHADDDDEDEEDDDDMDELLLHSQLAEELLFGDEDIDPVMQEVEAAIEAGDLNSLIDQFEQTEKTIQQLFTGSSDPGSMAAISGSSGSAGFSILKHDGLDGDFDDCSPSKSGAKKQSSPAKSGTRHQRSSATVTGRKSDCDNNNNSVLLKKSIASNKNGVKKSKKNRSRDGISLLAKPVKKSVPSSPSSKVKQQLSNALSCRSNQANVVFVNSGFKCQNSYSKASPVVAAATEKKTSSPMMERRLLHPNQNRLNADVTTGSTSCNTRSSNCSTLLSSTNQSLISSRPAAASLMVRSSNATAASDGTSSRFVQDHDYCPPAMSQPVASVGASASFPIILS